MNALPVLTLRLFRSQRGAALLVVLVFAAVSFIALSAYLLGAQMSMRQSHAATLSLQPLLTARSGAWWVIGQLHGGSRPDTLRTTSTLEQRFNADLLARSKDTTSADTGMPVFGGKPCIVNPFSSADFGSATVSLAPAAGFTAIISTGTFRDVNRTVVARLGGRPIVRPDTLVYLPPSIGDVHGNCPPKQQRGTFKGNNEINQNMVTRIVSYYLTLLQPDSTTIIADLPLIVRTPREVEQIHDTVNGPLLIDARAGRLTWRSGRTIRIFGDLQVTGDAHLEGLTFLVTGEIKLYDDATLTNVTLVTLSRFFMGDRTHYSGDALVFGTAAVYGRASITDRSTLVAFGRTSKDSSTTSRIQPKGPAFSIILGEHCTVDATVAALQNAGAIKTERDVEIHGVLFAWMLSHGGTLVGTAKAGALTDCSDPGHIKYNTVAGTFHALKEIGRYRLPAFLGTQVVVGWSED